MYSNSVLGGGTGIITATQNMCIVNLLLFYV
ncbi:MAG: hypothetical protein K0R34_2930 [Herbinix sp.]|jgi:hypothetical protein|nr:hypothetical protein [Herbinix sp.]